MKYFVIIERNIFESDSRDSKRHLKNHGGNECTVVDKNGKVVSKAIRTVNDRIINVCIGKEKNNEI